VQLGSGSESYRATRREPTLLLSSMRK